MIEVNSEMIEVNSLLFMGLWELVLLLLAVNVVLLVRFVIRRRREKASIERLVDIVMRDAERREKETHNLLEKKYGYSGKQLDKTTKKIINEEKRIYQIIANLFTERNSVAMENLSINFEEAVEPYRALMVPKIAESNDASGDGSGADLKQLKDLNQTLNEELRITMNTLSKMLHEYSVLLENSGVDKEDPDAVAAVVTGAQVPEKDTSSVAAGGPGEEAIPNVTTEAAAPAEAMPSELEEPEEAAVDVPDDAHDTDKDFDNAALVDMFQEDDEDSAAMATVANKGAAEALSAEEEMLNQALDLDNATIESEPTEESLAQEIGDVLESRDADLLDIELGEIEGEEVEAAMDPTEELLEQARDKKSNGNKAEPPDAEDKKLIDEAAAVDPTEELLAQAIGETLESHETPLPDFTDEMLEDEAEAGEVDVSEEKKSADSDAEKKLTDEIAETLSGHTETISDVDIDSLLQGVTEGTHEK